MVVDWRARIHRRARQTTLDRQLRAEVRAAKLAHRTTWGRTRKRLGWPLCALGVALFLATYVANFAGVVLLPFDMHHFVGQIGGGVLALIGLIWAVS
jgi:hypothetical protein